MKDNAFRVRATAARNNALRFAEQAALATDDAMKAYWRHLAVSWNGIAEQHQFLAEIQPPGGIRDATSSP